MLKVTQVEALENYELNVVLSDGRCGIFTAGPYLDKGIFKELKDKDYFRTVRPAFGGIVWQGGQDFSADTIAYEMKQLQET